MRSFAQRLAFAATATFALALSGAQLASAEDIDLYTGLQQNAGKPNVVIIFDDGSNSDANATFTCSATGLTVATQQRAPALSSVPSTAPHSRLRAIRLCWATSIWV